MTDRSYSNAAALGKAMQVAGVGCAGYHDDKVHPDAQTQGECGVRGVTVRVAVYASEDELQHQVERLFPGRGPGWAYLVVGPNWTVDCHRYSQIANLIKDRLGNEHVTIDTYRTVQP